MNRCVFAGVAGLCLGAAGLSQAAVVFEQLPDFETGYFSDSTGNYPNQRMAENFWLATGATIGTITVWAGYYTNNIQSDNFTVYIHADAGGVPGALLYSGAPASTLVVDSGFDAFGCDIYESNLTLATPFNAAAGTAYWVSIDNATGQDADWAWVTTNASDWYCAFTLDYGANWISFVSESLSLRLTEVPAPSGLAILGLGGLIAGRRRR